MADKVTDAKKHEINQVKWLTSNHYLNRQYFVYYKLVARYFIMSHEVILFETMIYIQQNYHIFKRIKNTRIIIYTSIYNRILHFFSQLISVLNMF